MKYIVFALLFNLFSCQDRVVENSSKIVSSPSICPDIPVPVGHQPSPYHFDSEIEIKKITPTQVTLSWQKDEHFSSYHIISFENSSSKIVQTITHQRPEVIINNLVPNKKYQFVIFALDHNGQRSYEQKEIVFTTPEWPNFINKKSILLNSAQSIELSESKNYLDPRNFTLALWVKTSYDKQKNKYILTFHKENYRANSSFAIVVNNSKFILKIDEQNYIPQSDFSNQQWNFLAITASSSKVRFYINGEESLSIDNNIPLFGNFKATIGAFSGIQKGFNGNIDEVAIFEKVLNKQEIQEIYNNGSSKSYYESSMVSHLTHWFQLGDHSQDNPQHIFDIIGNRHGIPLNFTVDTFVQDVP